MDIVENCALKQATIDICTSVEVQQACQYHTRGTPVGPFVKAILVHLFNFLLYLGMYFLY
jgi:hypothetical protein